MANTVQRVEYFYATVPDKPGEGRKILSTLKQEGVNLVAFLGFPAGGGKAQLDLVAQDAAALKRVAEKGGWKLVGPKRAFLVQDSDRVGAVADAVEKLAGAGINTTAASAATCGQGHYGMILWVAPADYDKAARALGA
jgi:hypothetical protein